MRGDDVLVLAAVGQDGGQPLLLGQAEEPLGVQQHVQGGEDRPAGDLGHGRHGERHVPARLAARGIDQAEMRAVEQQPDRHFGLAKQPLEAGLGAGLPVPIVRCGEPCRSRSRWGCDWMSIIQGWSASFGSTSLTAQVGRSVSLYSGRATSSAVQPCRHGQSSRSAGSQPSTV